MAADRWGTSCRSACGSRAWRRNGALLVITQITEVKWCVSFETPAQNQSAIYTALAAGIQFEARTKTTIMVQ